MTQNEKRTATDEDERIYPANPRGLGSNWGACMVCGGDERALRNDCAFFVPSRETGEAIVAMFHQGAKLDYRPYEPQWCQVKITACDAHKDELIGLIKAVQETRDRRDGPGISAKMVERFTHILPAPNSIPELRERLATTMQLLTEAEAVNAVGMMITGKQAEMVKRIPDGVYTVIIDGDKHDIKYKRPEGIH